MRKLYIPPVKHPELTAYDLEIISELYAAKRIDAFEFFLCVDGKSLWIMGLHPNVERWLRPCQDMFDLSRRYIPTSLDCSEL